MKAEIPPIWRIRKIGSHWSVLRLQPIRHTFYFPVAKVPTHQDALLWLCHRTGTCTPGDPMPTVIEESRDTY